MQIPSRKLEVSRKLNAKTGIIKDRNSKDPTETELTKRRQEYMKSYAEKVLVTRVARRCGHAARADILDGEVSGP